MRACAALVVIVLLAGCTHTVQLKYEDIVRGVEDPTTTVAMKVVDARAPEYGGTDKTLIGQVRGGFGNPFALHETDTQEVARLVGAATQDALRHARVQVGSSAARTLVATVKEFWLDGFVGYKATVEVQCDLQDERGAVLWTSVITGHGGGTPWLTVTGFVPPTFQAALHDYGEHALVEFSAPAFQKNLF